MNRTTGIYVAVFLTWILLFAAGCQPGEPISPDQIWPTVTQEMKPWVRWWWMGNAVSEAEISRQLDSLANAGFGGVEITPIYGVQGYENQYIDFLSPSWMGLLQFTIRKAASLNMGVDMNMGTGWPFGGPQITPALASSQLLTEKFSLAKGDKEDTPILPADPKQNPNNVTLLAIIAYFNDGTFMDLKAFLDKDNKLNWIANQDCQVVAVFNGKTLQRVKRAAPGGQGWTMDHFSKPAFEKYAARFDSAFSQIDARPRAFFNDSYEVYGANSTLHILEEFEQRRGYDLKKYLLALTSSQDNELNRRIQADYRQTLGELLRDKFTRPWVTFAHNQHMLARNQAHGSPANILDFYASADIPECETFGSSYFPIPGLRRDSADIRPVDPDPIMLKFATSAAHIFAKKQASSETFTWLAEHFKTSLSQCKPELDRVFLAGVNHVFYHGNAYSPHAAPWPGWLFYASVQFGPVNSFWPHLKGLNHYVARCQSILQAGSPIPDLMIYWPYHDTQYNIGRLDEQISIHNIDQWLHPTAFYHVSSMLSKQGYLTDFVSDDMTDAFHYGKQGIFAVKNGGQYKALIVPACQLMPLKTLQNILRLASAGATIIFEALPQDVPGYHNLTLRRDSLRSMIKRMDFKDISENIKEARPGKGRLILSSKVSKALTYAGLKSEPMTSSGLSFIRRQIAGERYYFIANLTGKNIDKPITLLSSAKKAILMDPDKKTFGKVSPTPSGHQMALRLQLKPGQTIIVRCTDRALTEIESWRYINKTAPSLTFDNPWKLSFHHGGPELPPDTTLTTLLPWTSLHNDIANRFSGVGTYENTFTIKDEPADDYLLSLPHVHESANIWINNQKAGILWSHPFELRIGKYVKKGKNSIRIDVANLMANRIRWMDQSGISWRIFHDINFVNIDYEPFDASNWNLMPSGLTGPIRLSPCYELELRE